ncbi:hypothetical protein [Burkholderia sp. Ac-20353]|uniref:hypothetical protein n=1 Tax=Burkholderia sp. Ac-20353 TaxID=2703894 RepID=UPI00197BFA1E|nr:hypothetical protein [Burkholderia sp. Ac-20353]MBN3791125.1 hypothetical protein [Burkholderia sp. Ac-20353]
MLTDRGNAVESRDRHLSNRQIEMHERGKAAPRARAIRCDFRGIGSIGVELFVIGK